MQYREAVFSTVLHSIPHCLARYYNFPYLPILPSGHSCGLRSQYRFQQPQKFKLSSSTQLPHHTRAGIPPSRSAEPSLSVPAVRHSQRAATYRSKTITVGSPSNRTRQSNCSLPVAGKCKKARQKDWLPGCPRKQAGKPTNQPTSPHAGPTQDHTEPPHIDWNPSGRSMSRAVT